MQYNTANGLLMKVDDVVRLPLAGEGSVGIQVSGTFVGTVVFEGTIDGDNFVSILVTPVGSATAVTSATGTGLWVASATSLIAVQARMTAYTSGQCRVTMGAAEASPGSVGAASGAAGHVIVDSGTLTAVTAITNALPAGNNNIGDVDVASIAAGTNSIGTTRLPVNGTATNANVSASDTVVTLQAANAARLGWTVWNDADKTLYVKTGAAASLTSATVPVPAGAYYELPVAAGIYSGILTGIWGATPTGAARVTEW